MLVYVFSLLAALLVGGASVVQQRAAAQAPPGYSLSPKLLVWLAQRPLWLAGVVCSVLGNLVFALALSRGSVALAEALLVARLLFALPLAAAWGRHRVPLRDWGGAVAITTGLIGFILAAQPREGTGEEVPETTWAVGGGTLVAVVVAVTVVASRSGPTRRAPLLGAGAGALFGLQASLTRSSFGVLEESGITGLLTTWNGYAVAAVAFYGMLLLQSGYESAPLPASYPAVVTAELLAGIGTGVGVLGGQIRLAAVALAPTLLCLLVMVGGIYILTTSALVTGELDRLTRRHEEGLARHAEAQVERALRRAHRDLDALEAHLDDPRSRHRDRRHLERDLARVDEELARLSDLQRDLDRHRQEQRERLRHLSDPRRREVAAEDRELSRWEQEIENRAATLRAHADRIKQDVRMLDRRAGGHEPPA